MTNEELENRIKENDNLPNLEKYLTEITKLVEKIPESYRIKAFEILLNHVLSGAKLEVKSENVIKTESKSLEEYSFQIPIEVRAFLRQFTIPEEKINDLFLITGQQEIAPTYKLKTTKAASAQIQLAVLTALENTLKGDGKFEFSIEDIRKRCNDYRCYDIRNFMTNFSNKKQLFKDLTDSEHVMLSPHGKEYLAEVLNEL